MSHPIDPFQLIQIQRDGTLATDLIVSHDVLETCQLTAQYFKDAAYQPPWVGYLAFAGAICVGQGGFKTPPLNGVVEIAYATGEPHQRKGCHPPRSRADRNRPPNRPENLAHRSNAPRLQRLHPRPD